MPRALALIVDSDANFRDRLARQFTSQGFEVRTAEGREQAQTLLATTSFDLHVDESALEAVKIDAAAGKPLRVAICPDQASLSETLQRGTSDSLIGACSKDDDALALQRIALTAAAAAELRHERRSRRDRARPSTAVSGLAGRSTAMEDLHERLQRLVPLDETVWIEGEAGVGKRWSAEFLHQLSAHRDAPFISLDESDLMSEGWESRWLGEELADGQRRTVYLKDPAKFSEQAQQRLAQLLNLSNPAAACRIVSGSTLRLDRAVDEGRMAPALAARLAAARLVVPPLRERIEDVGPLATQFIDEISAVNQLSAQRLSADALDRLESYSWPGNVRELRHAIEHATILAQEEIDLPQLPRAIRDDAATVVGGSQSDLAQSGGFDAGQSFREAKRVVVNAFEGRYLTALMSRQRGNVTSAAKESGMLRSALQRLLRKHELRSIDFRRRPQRSTQSSDGVVERDPDVD